MKKWILVMAVLMTITSVGDVYALGRKKKKKRLAETEVKQAKPLTPYEKLFGDKKIEKAGDKFLRLYKMEDKLYVEIPLLYLNREMLIASTLSETTSTLGGKISIGYKNYDPLLVKFTMEDSTVYLRKVNALTTYDQDLKKAVERNFGDPILYAYKVLAYKTDSTAVVVDMTDVFGKEGRLQELKPLPYSSGMVMLQGFLREDASKIAEIKSFDDNLCVKSYFTYDVTQMEMGMPVSEKEPVTVKVTRSLLLLPEQKMRPRISDARIGIFLTEKQRISTQEDHIQNYTLANRWRIEPKDKEAWKRGELVEPVKPIVFYVDDAFPELWKEPLKEGIMRWNQAFEKIGLKNVVRAVDFPKDDPEFDPDNLKYSCVRYLPSTVENAMGPSWVDPRTGEIINASVIVWNDIVKVINNWRFIQTAQLDESVRNKKMPDHVIKESIAYVVSHEIGHCLGFMHNMGASSAYPVDSLRSVSFTQKYGTTPSIMDYARFDYVAQPEDKGVRLTPIDLGAYDEFLIKWNYQPVLEAKTALEEMPIVEKWVDEKVGNPVYRYGIQQMASWGIWDPRALSEDLGDNAMKAGEYGIKNLKFILSNLGTWIKDDEDFAHREMLYQGIVSQYMGYLMNVVYNIGGICLEHVKEGTPGKPHLSVPTDIQRSALRWVIRQIKHSDWLTRPELKQRMKLQVDLAAYVRTAAIRQLLNRYRNVLLSAHVAERDPYTVKRFLDDFYQEAWSSTLNGRLLTETDRLMQKELTYMVIGQLASQTGGGGKMRGAVSASVKGGGACCVKELYPDKACFAPRGSTVERDWPLKRFGSGYGWVLPIETEVIDNSKIYFYDLALRMQKLLISQVNQVSGSAKLHYQSLLFELNRSLKTTK